MIGILRRPRAGATVIAAAAAFGAAVAAPPAHAAINQASCGSFIYGWNYWNEQLYNELAPSNGEVWTSRATYCAHMVIVYDDLVTRNNC